MRILLPAAATFMLCMSASAQSYSYETNTYRHGGTYSTVQSSSEQDCAETCRGDTKCLVWSFRKPVTEAGPSQCELKQTIGHAEENALMTSGVSPRFSEQQQAVVPPSTSDLLGGTNSQTGHETRTLSNNSTHVQTPISRSAPEIRSQTAAVQTPAAPTQVRDTAFGATEPVAAPHPSSRIVSPSDPRIVSNHTSQSLITTSTGENPQATRIPVQPGPPAPIRQGRPLPPPPRVNGATAPQPYDNLRNREFPRYSVQGDIPLEADSVSGAAGAGS